MAERDDAGFRRLWFADAEQRWLAADPVRRTATLWALKEAVYKAVNAGESWDPRSVEIQADGAEDFRCLYRGLPLANLALSVCDLDGHVAVIVRLPLEQSPAPSPCAARSHRQQSGRIWRFDRPTNHQPTVAFENPS